MKCGIFILLLGAAGCSSYLPCNQGNDAAAVASTFTKTAEYVYSRDFIGPDVDQPVEDHFSRDELRMIERHLPALNSMIETALGLQDSVGGAKLAAYFSLNNTNILRLIRFQILVPRNCYLWEGPDYSDPESYLTDGQYPYSIEYLQAMESLAGKPIWQAITLHPREQQMIQGFASDEGSEFHHWALWMQRKLKMKGTPNK